MDYLPLMDTHQVKSKRQRNKIRYPRIALICTDQEILIFLISVNQFTP